LPTLPSYYKALAPYPSNVYQWPTWDLQNSVVLLLALTQSRGGVALNAEDLGPDTLADVILAPLSPGVPPGQLKQIVDAWKKPVVFFRWAGSNDELDSLDPAGPQHVFRDPQDPTGLLLNSTWWNNSSTNPTYRQIFETYCHPLFTLQRNAPADGRPYQPFNSAPYPVGSGPYPTYPFPYYVWGYEYYMVPVVASAGKNKSFGFDPSSLATLYGMKPDPTGDDQDNIYSYRLR
jgi:hypothetical protein